MKTLRLLTLVCTLFVFAGVMHAQTPVAVHGQLSIDGNKLKDQNGNDYQLRGMSLFWSNWQGKFWNYDAIKWLRDDWNVNVVRAAMGISPEDNSGYLGRPEMEKQKMITVIEAAIDLGIYVIVDWHSHHAENETAEAKAFFEEIAQTYGSYPNIIYETYNEPVTDWGTIKNYHNAVLSSIRTYDANNVVILGTAFYSQNTEEATNSPVSGTDLCYALHYYAASHTFRDKIKTVSDKGYYTFVSEFGTCSSSGDGGIDVGSSNAWWDEMDAYGVSWCNWAVSDVDEAAAIVKPGSSIFGGWAAADLTENGTLVRNKLRSYAKDPVPTNIPPYITANPRDQSVPFETNATFSVEIAGPGPMTYQWYFNNAPISGASSASYTVASVTENEVGNYYCTIQNSYGTTTSKTVSLEVRYRSTFYADPQMLPSVIQFEDYDKGGQNIGYYDASFGNTGGEYRNDDVDIEAIQGMNGELAVGFTDNGEWLAYSVDVAWDGEYQVDVYYAANAAGGVFSLEMDNVAITPETNLPSTGGWFTYNKTTVTVNLTAGEHILKYNIINSGYNINYMEFKSTTPPETAPIITTNPKNTTATLGKQAFMYISATGAQPLSYQWYKGGVAINGATNDTYEIALVEEDDAGEYYVVVTNHLGVETSATATLTVNNSAAYGGVPQAIPGRVIAVNFDEGGEGFGYHDTSTENEAITSTGDQGHFYRDEGVDTEMSNDGGTSHSVGYINADEWLEYSVMVAYTGTYTVGFRVASGSNAGIASLALNVDGTPAVSTLTIANTGGWDAWTTLEREIDLTAGLHILRLKANQGDWNINYIDFSIDITTQAVVLNSGWNLFALPLDVAGADIQTLFDGVEGLIVKSKDGFYNATLPGHLQSLSTLEVNSGYLVFNGGVQKTIDFAGNEVITNPDFSQLTNGWHLIGVSGSSIDVSSLGTFVKTIKDLDSFYQQGDPLSDLTTLEVGKAYYVFIER